MCNIAGYVGKRQAAPILIEMLRKQIYYDGGFSTGIATISDGKLYMRKVLGDVETLIKETDALDLPGNIGIIHSRPSNDFIEFAHPFISDNGKMAVVLNGTCGFNKYSDSRNEGAQIAFDAGYNFEAIQFENYDTYPRLKNGGRVAGGEALAHLTSYYKSKGLILTQAFAKAGEQSFSERVALMIHSDTPDTIYANRITRPMNALIGENEVFLATTTLAFPDDIKSTAFPLPLMNICKISKNGVTITDTKIDVEEVSPITSKEFERGKRLVENLFNENKDKDFNYDAIESLLCKKSHEIWDEEHTYTQYAQLAYEIIVDLMNEGRITQEIRTQENIYGERKCAYMKLI